MRKGEVDNLKPGLSDHTLYSYNAETRILEWGERKVHDIGIDQLHEIAGVVEIEVRKAETRIRDQLYRDTIREIDRIHDRTP